MDTAKTAMAATNRQVTSPGSEHTQRPAQFIVHNLSRRGEVVNGVIEESPAGSGITYAVTWVLWNKTWSVVKADLTLAVP